ncbi:MAG: hypothetical protein AB7T38_11585 [Nitrospirales bacterium]
MSVFTKPRITPHPTQAWIFLVKIGFLLLIGAHTSLAFATEPFPLYLDERPFSPHLCKSTGSDRPIRIHVMNHRDLVIDRVDGQYRPADTHEARTKDYIHFISLRDLTDGILEQGAIAFDKNQAVVFTHEHPKGMARTAFLETLEMSERPLAERALATFLRLHQVFLAAIDTCRAYPPFTTYGTDDEIDRIEAGRQTFAQRVRAYNNNPTFLSSANIPDPGLDGGFVDPNGGHRSNVSYQAMNPLNFFVP